MQVYLAESFVVYDGSKLLADDAGLEAVTSSEAEQAYGLGESTTATLAAPENGMQTANISDEYGHETQGAVGNTPVRAQDLPTGIGASDSSSGTPICHGTELSSMDPLADPLQLNGELLPIWTPRL